MLRKVLTSLVVIFFKINLLAAECNVSHKLMYGIAFNERHPKRDIGYPYLISFNKKANLIKEKSVLSQLGVDILDNRTIDCKDESTCVAITNYLIKNDAKNLDLGAFQIAYIYHKKPTLNYFDLAQNYSDACRIVENNVAKYGYSWESIAKYHSYRVKNNTRYSVNLQKNLINLYPELSN